MKISTVMTAVDNHFDTMLQKRVHRFRTGRPVDIDTPQESEEDNSDDAKEELEKIREEFDTKMREMSSNIDDLKARSKTKLQRSTWSRTTLS